MNLYCKEQKTFTKQGQDNWDDIFNTKYVVTETCPGIYHLYTSKKINSKFITGDDKKEIDINEIKGVFDSKKDAKEFLDNIKKGI